MTATGFRVYGNRQCDSGRIPSRKTTTPPRWIPVTPVTLAMARTSSWGSSAISTADMVTAQEDRTSAAEAPLTGPMPSCAWAAAERRPGGVTPKNPPASGNVKPVSACQIIWRLWKASITYTVSPGVRYLR